MNARSPELAPPIVRAIRPGRFRAIIAATAEDAKVAPSEILSPARPRYLAWPRQVAMVLCLEIPGASLPQVGRVFRRDHTTVLHARRAVAARMTPELADTMARIRARASEDAT